MMHIEENNELAVTFVTIHPNSAIRIVNCMLLF